ncbi:MAG TPA: twin-arginine translocase subunit TatC [Chloroflexota bacterium]
MSVASSVRTPFKQPDPKYMTFVEHLEELRHRLIISVGAIALGSIVGWFLAKQVIALLVAPVRASLHVKTLYVPEVYGAFTINLKVAIIIGFAFALPVTMYQAWAFVSPAFGGKTSRVGPVVITSALVLFAGGVVTAYEVIPLALQFFGKFESQNLQVIPFASEYIGFISLILLVFGVSFELPLVLVSLSAIGITSSRWLSRKRIHFFFGIFIFATVATPGADAVSPIILGGILYVLFELSIVISRLIGK